MRVILREKKGTKNRSSLYLDIYNNKVRDYKFLKLYIFTNPKSSDERNHNALMRRKADIIRAKLEVELIDNTYGIITSKQSTIKFLDYFKILKEEKRGSIGNYGTWNSAYKILCSYFDNKDLRLKDLTKQDLSDIRDYILNRYRTKTNKKLSQNAASIYFGKIRICLKKAHDEDILEKNLLISVKSIPPADTNREYLTKEEVRSLIKTPCQFPTIKNAFLFGVFSGLRFSDIVKLKWQDINYSESVGTFIKYKQQKTKTFENLPLPDNAIQFLGIETSKDDKVFKGLYYSTWTNATLLSWINSAGINRHITFHASRHTYATLLINAGHNAYGVSKLLGHKNFKTTQIYMKISDLSKVDIVKSLNDV